MNDDIGRNALYQYGEAGTNLLNSYLVIKLVVVHIQAPYTALRNNT